MNQQIHQAYLGELYGIAFFTLFKNIEEDATRIALWDKLIEVESITAEILLSHLLKQPETYPFDVVTMTEKGQQDARKWLHLPWEELLKTLYDWAKPYEQEYRNWQASATEHQSIMTIIAQHETAILNCFSAELQQKNGQAYLDHYLENTQLLSSIKRG
ncbi:hypothetical protein [Shewanella sp. ENK2]|uniref:hypothetical protein n=1 Tax=Shewanella sp. ENK2 TaxID=2775245 RepID=UPI0037488C3D